MRKNIILNQKAYLGVVACEKDELDHVALRGEVETKDCLELLEQYIQFKYWIDNNNFFFFFKKLNLLHIYIFLSFCY